MNKIKRIILCIILGFTFILPAINLVYAKPSDIIYDILARSDSDNNTRRLIENVLNKDKKKTVKIIKTQKEVEEVVKEKEIKDTNVNYNSYILGVDISKWNGNINWKDVKSAGIQFVIIRAGYGTGYVDPYFKKNIEAAIENKMLIGIYWFSYAYTYQQAKLEADKCYKTIKPYKKHITLPVFWDFEYDSVNHANKRGHHISKELASNMANTFCLNIKNKGLHSGIYTNIDYSRRYFTQEVLSKYHTWIAQWRSSCSYKYNYVLWQCSDSYVIGNKKFDLNRFYFNRYKRDLKKYSSRKTKTMTVYATAYSGDNITSLGYKPKWGVIAVDPKVIPYGSIVYIQRFDKTFIALDCGGGIKGNRIDIFMNSEKECIHWGVRKIEIQIFQ